MPEEYRKFEASILQNFVNTMMPKDSEAFYGKVSAGEFWQSMMAWRFGHPRGVLLPNGDIFVAYYAGDAYSQSVHWVRIDPSQG